MTRILILFLSACLAAILPTQAAPAHGLLLQDGKLVGWGDNLFGQVAAGKAGQLDQPELITLPGTQAVAVATGARHSLAVDQRGRVWAWGDNSSGQLGLGHTRPVSGPMPLSGLPGKAVMVAAGAQHSVALLADGSVWAWGSNPRGQLGRGAMAAFAPAHAPAAVPGLTSVKAIAAGDDFCLARLADGRVMQWGSGRVDATVLVALPAVKRIRAHGTLALAQDSQGKFWQWQPAEVGLAPKASTAVAYAELGKRTPPQTAALMPDAKRVATPDAKKTVIADLKQAAIPDSKQAVIPDPKKAVIPDSIRDPSSRTGNASSAPAWIAGQARNDNSGARNDALSTRNDNLGARNDTLSARNDKPGSSPPPAATPDAKKTVIADSKQAVIPDPKKAAIPDPKRAVIPDSKQAVIPGPKKAVIPDSIRDPSSRTGSASSAPAWIAGQARNDNSGARNDTLSARNDNSDARNDNSGARNDNSGARNDALSARNDSPTSSAPPRALANPATAEPATQPPRALQISGRVFLSSGFGGDPSGAERQALAQVTVAAEGAQCAPTDSAGRFSCTVAAGWSGRLVVRKNNYRFSPSALNYQNLRADAPGQDFVAVYDPR